MSVNLLRKLAILGVVLFVTPACGQKSNPARPSVVVPSSNDQGDRPQPTVILTNLTGNFVGLANEVCDGAPSVAIDNLVVSYEVTGTSLAGAMLVACPSADCDGGTPLGTIAECPLPPNPCEAGLPAASEGTEGSACLVGDPSGVGTLRVFATRPADAPASWHIAAYLEQGGDRTNTVSATLDQADVVVPPDSAMDSARFVTHRAR